MDGVIVLVGCNGPKPQVVVLRKYLAEVQRATYSSYFHRALRQQIKEYLDMPTTRLLAPKELVLWQD